MKISKYLFPVVAITMCLSSCSEDNPRNEVIELNSIAFFSDSHVKTSTLPQPILTYISTNYPNVYIKEAEIEDNGNYEIELSNGLELVFDADGTFLGIDDDNDNDFGDVHLSPSDLPQNILTFIATHFSQYSITEAEKENNGNYEVELNNGTELIFNSEGVFLGIGEDENEDEDEQGERDIDPSELPQNIKDYINANYPNNTIIEAEIEDDGGYEVTLNNGVELEFDAAGNFIKAEDGNGDDDDDNEEEDD